MKEADVVWRYECGGKCDYTAASATLEYVVAAAELHLSRWGCRVGYLMLVPARGEPRCAARLTEGIG